MTDKRLGKALHSPDVEPHENIDEATIRELRRGWTMYEDELWFIHDSEDRKDFDSATD